MEEMPDATTVGGVLALPFVIEPLATRRPGLPGFDGLPAVEASHAT